MDLLPSILLPSMSSESVRAVIVPAEAPHEAACAGAPCGSERAGAHAFPLLLPGSGPLRPLLPAGAGPLAPPETGLEGAPEGGQATLPPRCAASGTAVARATVQPDAPAPTAPAVGRRSPGQARWIGSAEPERPAMEILFAGNEGGRRYYAVRLNGQQIFVGTRPECDRFLEIHEAKVALEQAEARRIPRARPFPVRTYRAARA